MTPNGPPHEEPEHNSPATDDRPTQSRRPVDDAERVASAHQTLDHIRQKMESVAEEFAAGKINRAQFNAIYGHYSEKRAIIEKILERNPENDAWRQVARPGHTSFLRVHFEAKPAFYIVFRHGQQSPLIYGGAHPKEGAKQIVGVLRQLWKSSNRPPRGLARKNMNNGYWMVVAFGEYAATIAIFSLQPSMTQSNLISDLHNDFESANRLSLRRNLSAERMVFPQRALLT